MAQEGSLEAPERHPIPWNDPEFYDAQKFDEELRRVFDICHGCRRCFNLCDSFPRLFDLIDDSETGELDSVDSKDFGPVIDACTLCDLCFMTKCPYVPPHEFNLDFPHLMLQARAIEQKKNGTPFFDKQLTETDRNGKFGCSLSGLANWGSKLGNGITRPLMESVAGVHQDAYLPAFHAQTLVQQSKQASAPKSATAKVEERRVVLYATCFANYNTPAIGKAARNILTHNGCEVEVAHPGCCGMPQLEQGDLPRVAEHAKRIAAYFKPWIERGYRIVPLVPSCSLMLKFEWPLIVPDSDDVKMLSGATSDISEYICDIAKNEGLAEGMKPLDSDVTVHIACHARAQNMGQKSAELLRLIPDANLNVIERCSGHGGAWGVKKDNFDVAIRVGKPVAREAAKSTSKYLVSECPLARDHIVQGIEKLGESVPDLGENKHPVELMALAYGFGD